MTAYTIEYVTPSASQPIYIPVSAELLLRHRLSAHFCATMNAVFPRCPTLADTHSRILIVEDDGDIAALIAHYLDKAGYASEIAADGSRGLASAREAPPDLVILDLMLPGLNGLEVCKALRQHNRTAALPIIMLTARGEESERILGLDAGADDYIVKPFSPNELMARVRALLRRSSTPVVKDRVLRCGPFGSSHDLGVASYRNAECIQDEADGCRIDHTISTSPPIVSIADQRSSRSIGMAVIRRTGRIIGHLPPLLAPHAQPC